jgi:ribonuclease BN (tRNA processing enzyme)
MIDVYGISTTLETLSSHLVDGVIYPEFTQDTSFLGKASLEFNAMEPFKARKIAGYAVLALPVRHSLPAVGFEITAADGKSVFYSGDTGPDLSSLWEYTSPDLIIIDLTFPDRLRDLALSAGHLCPSLLRKELFSFRKVKGYSPRVVATHLSPQFEREIKQEISGFSDELELPISIVSEGGVLLL